MSISIEQVLADAKRLVERLRSHDTAADALIQQTTGLNKRIETMTEFQEDIEEMNNIARHRPRTALILGIQRENRQIRQLQEENAELVATLKQHQAALDLIMSSYREQITRIRSAQKSEKDLMEKHSHETQESSQYIHKILEMAAVMQRAADSDETYCYQMEEMVSKLEYENKGLRELLRITKSVTKSASGPSSPQSPKSEASSGKEQSSQSHNKTMILNSRGLKESNRVVVENNDSDSSSEEEGETDKSRVVGDGDLRLKVVDELDIGGGGTGGDGFLGLAQGGSKSKLVGKKLQPSKGAISKLESANKNNNHGTVAMDTRTIMEKVAGDGSGPKGVVLGSGLPNSQTVKMVPATGSSGEEDSLSEDYDTTSLSSQSSMSTVKEADSISITSELSESGGDAVDRFTDQSIVSLDSTHL